MNTPRIASGYTTRANYHAEYRESHRDAINARKRAWRKERKLKQVLEREKQTANILKIQDGFRQH